MMMGMAPTAPGLLAEVEEDLLETHEEDEMNTTTTETAKQFGLRGTPLSFSKATEEKLWISS
jgi:hypothetical protein